MGGGRAAAKARVMAASILTRSRRILQKMKIPDFEKVHVQVLGAEESFGASGRAEDSLPRSAIQHVKVLYRSINGTSRNLTVPGKGT